MQMLVHLLNYRVNVQQLPFWNPVVDVAEKLEQRQLRGSRAQLHLRGAGHRVRMPPRQVSWACGAKRRLQAVQGRVHPKELDGLLQNCPPPQEGEKRQQMG